MRSAVLRAATMAAVLAACSPAPTLTPQPSAGPVASTSSEATAAAPTSPASTETAPSPGGSPDPAPEAQRPASSAGLIREALAEGRIDRGTALLYRLYATTADPKLPEEFTGQWSEDNVAFASAARLYPTLSGDLQAAIRPFIVRPTDRASVWAGRTVPPEARSEIPSRTVSPVGHLLGNLPMPFPNAAFPCVNNWISTQVSPNIPVVIWAPCGAERGLNNVRNMMAGLWQPMTAFMGPPILDANIADDDYPDCPECGDGKLDIYLALASEDRSREIEISDALGFCVVTAPVVGAAGREASSSYIVIDYVAHASDADLENTIAHEFFHSLQDAHNSLGMWSGPEGDEESHWFVEASATWAEFNFVPHGRFETPYQRFIDFQRAVIPLGATGGDAYREWGWPLFMHQERRASSISAAWQAFEDQTGTLNLQQRLNAQLPFASQFREFAVRVWNQRLMPGDPIPKRFEQMDPDFPGNIPGQPRLRYDETLTVQGETEAPRPYIVYPEALQVTYARFKVDDLVGKIQFDFSGITPSSRLDVDALLEIRDKGWERRDLGTGEKTLCLDKPKDDVKTIILVLSNHDLDLDHPFDGIDWTIKATAGCGDLVGVLTVDRSVVFDQNETGLPEESSEENLTATISVVMNRDQSDPFGGFINKRSSFHVSRGTTASRENGDCTARFDTRTEGTWKFTDHPVGVEWESGISAFVDRPSLAFGGSVVVHYPFSIELEACGGGLYVENAVHDVFGCAGGITGELIEIDDADDLVTVDCRLEQDNSGSFLINRTIVTIQGVLTLRDETTP